MQAAWRMLVVTSCAAMLFSGCVSQSAQRGEPLQSGSGFVSLFQQDGTPAGWRAGLWNDVSIKPTNGTTWVVTNGVLYGSAARGTWLMSEKDYSDFVLEFEFKLGPRGNSGCALRAPLFGDPAFDGMELQMADYRYNTEAKDSELTGGLYRALAPTKQVYKPQQWNRYHIELRGSHIRVVLNDQLIQDTDLNTQTNTVKRHDGTLAVPLRDRPRRGHIGFQELSREGGRVMIRNARIKEL